MTQLSLIPVNLTQKTINREVARRTRETVETIAQFGFTELNPATVVDSDWRKELGPLVDRLTDDISATLPIFLGECWNCGHKCETDEPSASVECPACDARTMEYIPQG